MPEEPLLERLERLKAKQNRGEKLTDEEIEQLKADMREFNDAMSGVAGRLMVALAPTVRAMNDALQPLAELGDAMELKDLEADNDAN
ncbi:hypothetical protein OSG_eHP32_00145 [environmental Halophage eHP-32]|nr:hypothetical protein OSG_eHP32_00145 [environmental Halophage eHP-32]